MNALYKLPRSLLVTLLLSGGIAYIVLNDPPHSFCDTQTERFQFRQKGVFIKDPGDKIHAKPLIGRLIDTCWETNAPGGCYEYFSYLKRLLDDFFLVSEGCLSQVSGIKEVKEHLFEGVRMMTLLAWREKALSGKISRLNWLNRMDMSLFCSLKANVSRFYGRKALLDFEKKLLAELPVSEKYSSASPGRLRDSSILSENCAEYAF